MRRPAATARTILAVLLALVAPRAAQAWPAAIVEALARDARRLVPSSLAQFMADHEKEIFEASRAMSP